VNAIPVIQALNVIRNAPVMVHVTMALVTVALLAGEETIVRRQDVLVYMVPIVLVMEAVSPVWLIQ
jgi:hypothetical protein